MSIAKIIAVLGAATIASAINGYEVAEFNAIVVDVQANLNEYISLAENNADFQLPDGVLDVYTQLTTYTDESYTTLFSAINFEQVTTVMHQLPWYTTRLAPIISSYLKAHSITDTVDPAVAGANAVATSAAESASAKASEASSKAASASSKASSVSSEASASSKASSSSSKASSSASSVASSVSSAASSAASSASSAASSASSAASSSTSAGAAANLNALGAGMGAIVAGAAALLL